MKIQLLNSLKNYNAKTFIDDALAGFVVMVIALPLAIAIGIACGVSPSESLITAIVGGFIGALLGGTKFQITAPVTAFVTIIYSIIQQYGMAGLMTTTMMAGILLIIFSFLKLGRFVKFISAPLVVGFTAGVAVLIFTIQIPDLFGFKVTGVSSHDFIGRWIAYFKNLDNINMPTLLVSSLTIGTIVLFPKITKKIPSAFVALILVTIIVKIFNLPVETLGSRFGEVTISKPNFSLPTTDLQVIKSLFIPALTIAVLVSIESLLSLVVGDSISGDKSDSDTELFAQGVANFITPFFGGLPATGAPAKTITNLKSGAKTPVAGMMYAVFLFIVLIFFKSYLAYIPMATLAGVLVVVSYNMSGWRKIEHLLHAPKADSLVLFSTIILTVIYDITIAISIGLIISSFNFMNNMHNNSQLKCITQKNKNKNGRSIVDKIDIPDNVLIYEPCGAFFFAVSTKFENEFKNNLENYSHAIIRLKHVSIIDASGLIILENIIKNFQSKNVDVLLLQMPRQISKKIKKFGIVKMIGEDRVFENIEDALEYIRVEDSLANIPPLKL